jgi:hypothetical protein
MVERAADIQVHWPGNRVPVTGIIDDPTPCRNPAWYEHPDEGHVSVIPNSFTEHFADTVENTGSAGKFSVVPCPGAQGRIDEGMPGVSAEDMDGFLRVVRERIAPRWDICPELLTHNLALDLDTMQPLELKEDAWVARQDEATLVAYIGRALQILRNVGLEPNGVTSPWTTGREVEDRYARAIGAALNEVCGVRLGWYFLHVDPRAPDVIPRIMQLDATAGTALVSIVSGSMDLPEAYDFAWRTQFGEPAVIDTQLSADGGSGRFLDLYRAGSPIVFHTHWQSLFSNGSGAGLKAFDDLCRRINRTWGERTRWTTARELATYCAARAATRFQLSDEGRRISVTAPFSCAMFTFSVPAPAVSSALLCDGERLEQVGDDQECMEEGTWCFSQGRARVCLSLKNNKELNWQAQG